MSDVQNFNDQSHFDMEEQFAADAAPVSGGGSARVFLMFSLVAFGAIGGYVNANWDSYKEVLNFASAGSDNEAPCCKSERQPPPESVLAAAEGRLQSCQDFEQTATCCSLKGELAAATGGEAPCCSQMSKAIVAAMLEVSKKSDDAETHAPTTPDVVVE